MPTARNRSSIKLILLFFTITLLALLVVFAAIPRSTLLMHVLHKSGHPAVFGAISLLVLWILNETGTSALPGTWQKYFQALGIAIFIGGATEVLQQFTHRDSRWADLVSDAVGATACLALHAAWFGPGSVSKQRFLKRGLMLLGFLAAIIAVSPMAWCLMAYAQRDGQFPVIAQCGTPLDLYFISRTADNPACAHLPRKWARDDSEKALRIDLAAGRYPGMQSIEPFPYWRGYRSLAVDITNPGDSSLDLVIRVHDHQHNREFNDRFNGPVKIDGQTRMTVVVPLESIERAPKRRFLKLDSVANVGVFALQPEKNGEFFVSRIWLQ